jgi:hypothetical protein
LRVSYVILQGPVKVEVEPGDSRGPAM